MEDGSVKYPCTTWEWNSLTGERLVLGIQEDKAGNIGRYCLLKEEIQGKKIFEKEVATGCFSLLGLVCQAPSCPCTQAAGSLPMRKQTSKGTACSDWANFTTPSVFMAQDLTCSSRTLQNSILNSASHYELTGWFSEICKGGFLPMCFLCRSESRSSSLGSLKLYLIEAAQSKWRIYGGNNLICAKKTRGRAEEVCTWNWVKSGIRRRKR